MKNLKFQEFENMELSGNIQTLTNALIYDDNDDQTEIFEINKDYSSKRTKTRNANVNIVDRENLDIKQRELLESLDTFFTEDILKKIVIPIKKQYWNISLRTLDYLVTKYAHPDAHNVQYYRTSEDKFPWNLYSSYREMLEFSGPKTKFDPFCRGDRIIYQKGSAKVETTVAQLNFFRWAIKNKVLDWAVKHASEIQRDIDKKTKESRILGPKSRIKRPRKSRNIGYQKPLIIKFDVFVQNK